MENATNTSIMLSSISTTSIWTTKTPVSAQIKNKRSPARMSQLKTVSAQSREIMVMGSS